MREIENQKTDTSSKPYAEVRILSCGELIPKSKGEVELPISNTCKCSFFLSVLIIVNRNMFVMDGEYISNCL